MDDDAGAGIAELRDRVERAERTLAEMGVELRTRRVVVADDGGHERAVIEIVDDVAEIRVLVPGTETGKSCVVALFAAAVTSDGGPGAGLQVMADGDSVIELAAWRVEPRRWDANLHIE
jgi:hypothetical protein